MKRAIVLCFVILLSGCPAYFSASLKNQSDIDIQVHRLNQDPDIVRANTVKAVNWYRGCQAVTVEGSVRYLVLEVIPEGTFEKISNRETRFNVVFDGKQFFLQKNEGGLLQVDERASCENT